jgi:hypothetical protein
MEVHWISIKRVQPAQLDAHYENIPNHILQSSISFHGGTISQSLLANELLHYVRMRQLILLSVWVVILPILLVLLLVLS